jgi:adenine-specific DNA-methyltransferase
MIRESQGVRPLIWAHEPKFLKEMTEGLTSNTWWTHEEVGSNKEASIDLKTLFGDRDDVFQTPKPEKLIHRIFSLLSQPGDWILDSFAGSGTSGAVAHKMGRRWIMVELGEHCHTQIIPRLKMVIEGADPYGITEMTEWQGGGGFRYYTLAPSLLEKDSFGNLIVSKKYNPAMLAEALCKLEGFTYAPSETEFWQHGHSTESDFLYVTTQTLTRDQLADLSERVGDKRTLLVLCTAFRAKGLDEFPNLTVKKIPKTIQHRCEWGKDDYSLEIKNLPAATREPDPAPQPPINGSPRSRRSRTSDMPLFGGDDQ